MSFAYTEDVLPVLKVWRQAGHKTALVTLVNTEGSSPRPLGSQMAVNDQGQWVGLITGGCAEAAIAAEARAAIESGENRCVRFGAGSRYMDVKLPCGSGIDVFFDVRFSNENLLLLLDAQSDRKPLSLKIDLTKRTSSIAETDAPDSFNNGECFFGPYQPKTRLLVIGKGAILPFLANMAAQTGYEVIAASPEEETLNDAKPFCRETIPLSSEKGLDETLLDQWTAVAILFHEHEWETEFLVQALQSECFYIGALGSKKTHSDRLQNLHAMNIPEALCEKIRGPIGLDIHAKSPPEIATSIMAEIIQTHRQAQNR